MAKVKADFSAFFAREAKKNIIPSYKRLISKGQGVDIDYAPRHKNPSNNKPWLIDTGETNRKGYNYRAGRDKLIIFASGAKHTPRVYKNGTMSKKQVTYRQLFKWHNTAGGRYSGIFGILPKNSAFPARFRAEATRQLMPQMIRLIIGK